MKLLLFLLLVLALWVLWRSGSRRTKMPPQPPAGTGVETMVACAHCGVHLPRSEAVPGDGASYCCEAHRQKGSRPQ